MLPLSRCMNRPQLAHVAFISYRVGRAERRTEPGVVDAYAELGVGRHSLARRSLPLQVRRQ